MSTFSYRFKRGITFVELLVVIAIIGVLSAFLLARSETSRTSARDSRRISELRGIQGGLEGFFARYSQYPADLTVLVNEGYIQDKGRYDPKYTTTPYQYAVSSDRKKYCLGANLENIYDARITQANQLITGNTLCSGLSGVNYKVAR